MFVVCWGKVWPSLTVKIFNVELFIKSLGSGSWSISDATHKLVFFTKHKLMIRHQEMSLFSWWHWQTKGFVSVLVLCDVQYLCLVMLEWSEFRLWNPKTAASRETLDTLERIWKTQGFACSFSIVQWYYNTVSYVFWNYIFSTISLNNGATLKAPDLQAWGNVQL